MKAILEKIVQLRNPQFRFDPAISSSALFALFAERARCLLRGMRVLWTGRQPRFLMLDRGVRFFNRANIRWGRWVKLGERVYLSAMGSGQLTLGDNVGIGAYSRLVIATSFNYIGAHITIGNNVGLGEFAYLGGGGGLTIGDDCIIGQYLSCHPENHHFEDPERLIRHQGVSRKGIHIGRNCWIGSKVTVLDGVTIGDNCVIAAGAVVTKDMPANSIIGGVPAKVLRPTVSPLKKTA
ncbi:MAG: acyltransferase [Bacteroidota bacterium]